jgi:hypothetical protein
MRLHHRTVAAAALACAVFSAIVATAALASTFGTSSTTSPRAGCAAHTQVAVRGPQPIAHC